MKLINFIILGLLLLSCGYFVLPVAYCEDEKQATETKSNQDEEKNKETGRAKLVFINVANNEEIKAEHVPTSILIKYKRSERKKGTIQRWKGDTSGKYEYTVEEEKEFNPGECKEGILELTPGFYSIKHNSVKGESPSGMYGKSSIFEIKVDEEIEVTINLFPAI